MAPALALHPRGVCQKCAGQYPCAAWVGTPGMGPSTYGARQVIIIVVAAPSDGSLIFLPPDSNRILGELCSLSSRVDISPRCAGATTDFTSVSVRQRRLPCQQMRGFLLSTLHDPLYVSKALTVTSRSHVGITRVSVPVPWRGRLMRSIPQRHQGGMHLPSSPRVSSQAHLPQGLFRCHPTARSRRLGASVRAHLI